MIRRGRLGNWTQATLCEGGGFGEGVNLDWVIFLIGRAQHSLGEGGRSIAA